MSIAHDHRPGLQPHSHTFGQDIKRPGEARTLIVTVITAIMMIVEIVAGIMYGSMALLADGLHMASHAAALTISVFAYIYARHHADDERFSFGTGKVNTLGGYTGAVLLAAFALAMVLESVARFVAPVEIAFDQAIFVAIIGLLVNGVSVFILGQHHHPEAVQHLAEEFEEHAHYHDHHYHAHDQNLLAAYLHVLADALTSVLAIIALLAAKYFGLFWADPAMGIVGAYLVTRWSIGLLHSTGVVLLDRQGPDDICKLITQRLEADEETRVADLHLWAVGPQLYSAIIAVASHAPKPPDYYKSLIPKSLGIAHLVVEVNTCTHEAHDGPLRASDSTTP